jgi:hypothetical protein
MGRRRRCHAPKAGDYPAAAPSPRAAQPPRRRGCISVGVVPSLAPVRNDSEIETAITAREPGSGFLAMPDNFLAIHRASIISAAAINKVPVVYQQAVNAREGGLLASTADQRDIFRRAATYVDIILRGGKASELPRSDADQIHHGCQHEDREGARPHGALEHSGPRNRGHRITAFMSVYGTEPASRHVPSYVSSRRRKRTRNAQCEHFA